jgi:hypothetical protein
MKANSELRRLERALALIESKSVTVADGQASVRSTSGNQTYTFAVGATCPCEDEVKPCKHMYAAQGKAAVNKLTRAQIKDHPGELADAEAVYWTEMARIAQSIANPQPPAHHFKAQIAHIRAKGAGLIVLAGGEVTEEADFAFSGGSAAYRALVNGMGSGYSVTLRARATSSVRSLDEIQGLSR